MLNILLNELGKPKAEYAPAVAGAVPSELVPEDEVGGGDGAE